MANISTTGTRTQVARVKAEYPNQLDYSGIVTPWWTEPDKPARARSQAWRMHMSNVFFHMRINDRRKKKAEACVYKLEERVLRK